MSSEDKDKIINDIYYNESGYGSVKTTYNDARLKNNKITLKYVQNWFDKNMPKKRNQEAQTVLSLHMLIMSISLTYSG